MIYVIARFTLKPGTCKEFLTHYAQIIDLVHAEPGCIEYTPTVDMSAPFIDNNHPNADAVTVFEKWETLQQLDDHILQPHCAAFRDKVKDLIADFEMHVTEAVEFSKYK